MACAMVPQLRVKPVVLLLCCVSILLLLLLFLYTPSATQVRASFSRVATVSGLTWWPWSNRSASHVIRPTEPSGPHNVDLLLTGLMDRLLKLAEADKTGSYQIIENLLTSHSLTSESKNDVTLATQCTSAHLHYLDPLSQQWQGPVSVAVFTYDDDFHFAVTSILYLHLCFASVASHLTFHLVFPTGHQPDTPTTKLSFAQPVCSGPPEDTRQAGRRSTQNFVLGSGIEYPVNLLRSLAVRTVTSTYVFYSDVDMTPSDNLRSAFIRDVVNKSSNISAMILTRDHSAPQPDQAAKVAYVVPVFERRKRDGSPPLNKSDLLQTWARKEVRQFYGVVSPHCQAPTNYSRWRTLPVSDKMAAAYRVQYRPRYEPYYIAPSSLPLYDERFRQWGRDRQSQVCEMHVAGFQLVVLNNAFLVHDGYKNASQRPATWRQEITKNSALYRQFQKDLRIKYPGVVRNCTSPDS